MDKRLREKLIVYHEELIAKTAIPPIKDRVPLLFKNTVFATLEPGLIGRISQLYSKKTPRSMIWDYHYHADGYLSHLTWEAKPFNHHLAVVAQLLKEDQLCGAWRDELLAVKDTDGNVLGELERGVCRQFGVETEAIHLVGYCGKDDVWVQQRAHNKPNDPSKWDTLVGGMIASEDNILTALERETWEEAGLLVAELKILATKGTVHQHRPSDDGYGAYLAETVHWMTARVPSLIKPVNQDGEVAQFALLPAQTVLEMILQDEFTLEASLILLDALKSKFR